MVIPLRILQLCLAAVALGCAGMTLVLIASHVG